MFPITLTLTVHTTEQLTAVYNALAIGKMPVMHEAKSATGATIKSTNPDVLPKGAAPTPPAPPAEPEKPKLTYEKDISPALVAYAKEHGRAGLEAVLKEFNVAKGTDLQPAQFEAVLARVKG